MERPPKRRRLFAPLDSELSQSFDNRHEFYDAPDELYEEESEPAYDPDQDLQQKRARLDLKLKSTFESIFEKYGKDFDGVGDEIDLYTGEILVDNGHLEQMQNERDAGNSSRARIIPRTLLEDDDSVEGGYFEDEDEEDDEEDYGNDDGLSDEDMVEDDLILRGFAQARQFMERRPALQQSPFDTVLGRRKEPRENTVALHPTRKSAMLPSRSNILSQFGPQLGSEIVKYVSKQGTLEDDNIEPMWRAPPIWRTTGGSRPITKPTALPADIERPVSPDNSPSIWAPTRSIFRAEDDKLLQEFVTNARRVGLDLSNDASWEKLEHMYPRHKWRSWKTRYEKKFSYLYAGHADESDISTSDVSTDAPWISDRRDLIADSGLGFASSSTRHPAQRITNERPARVRNQVPRDSTILSWTDAVATIKSVDPDLHAELLRDAKKMKSDASFGFQRLTPSSRIAERHVAQDSTVSREHEASNQDINGLSKLATHSNIPLEDSEDELSLYNSESHGATHRVPCPHVECKDSQSTLYRLGYRDGEELSPLCLHLLHAHHITPYPCAEFNCDRKGERGYFMQEDLVKHVKDTHPYSTALSRLRGRVDAELLGQGLNSTNPKLSTHLRPSTPVSQPQGSKFMSPRGRTGHLGQPRTLPSSSATQDLTSAPRPAHYISASASSLHVGQSSQTGRGLDAREYSVEKLYDSDVQILDGNPFLADKPSPLNEVEFPCPLHGLVGCDERFPTQEIAITHSLIHDSDRAKTQCTYPGCNKMISTALASTMIAHLKTHETHRSNISTPLVQQVVAFEPQPLMPAGIPDSLHSAVSDARNKTSNPVKRNRAAMGTRISDPLPRNTVDPSYQFSDEELELPPLPKQAPNMAKVKPAQPRPARKSMPSTSAKTSSGPVRKKAPLVTPSATTKTRTSAVQSAASDEEFDELSLPDVMFISSRPRAGVPSNAGSQSGVKQEDADVPSGAVQSSRKKRASMVGQSDEIDELGSDEVIATTSARRVPILPEQPEIKTEEEQATAASKSSRKSPVATNKSRRQGKSALPAAPEPVATPTRTSHKQSSGTNTPLIDLVGDDDDDDFGMMIPPTSELGYSSPTARQAHLRAGRQAAGPGFGLRTAAGLRRAPRATIKEEGDEAAVWTPGGTLRRCGQDGFACGRPFCFSCPRHA